MRVNRTPAMLHISKAVFNKQSVKNEKQEQHGNEDTNVQVVPD